MIKLIDIVIVLGTGECELHYSDGSVKKFPTSEITSEMVKEIVMNYYG